MNVTKIMGVNAPVASQAVSKQEKQQTTYPQITELPNYKQMSFGMAKIDRSRLNEFKNTLPEAIGSLPRNDKGEPLVHNLDAEEVKDIFKGLEELAPEKSRKMAISIFMAQNPIGSLPAHHAGDEKLKVLLEGLKKFAPDDYDKTVAKMFITKDNADYLPMNFTADGEKYEIMCGELMKLATETEELSDEDTIELLKTNKRFLNDELNNVLSFLTYSAI